MMDIDDGAGANSGHVPMEVEVSDMADEVQLYDRVDDRSSCTRPPLTKPSLKLPKSTNLHTHSHFRVKALSSSASSSRRQVSQGKKRKRDTQAPLHVTLSACVMPNSVWPEQVVKAKYTTKQSHGDKIAYASRLQHVPAVRDRPLCLKRVQTCLTNIQLDDSSIYHLQQRSIRRGKLCPFPMWSPSAHRERSRLTALQACDMAAAFAK